MLLQTTRSFSRFSNFRFLKLSNIISDGHHDGFLFEIIYVISGGLVISISGSLGCPKCHHLFFLKKLFTVVSISDGLGHHNHRKRRHFFFFLKSFL